MFKFLDSKEPVIVLVNRQRQLMQRVYRETLSLGRALAGRPHDRFVEDPYASPKRGKAKKRR